ncbi:MAG TPA: cytochrome c [Alphaproteobacteria bacterium]|nr:cytochrome c [Alphaproteobacteria bacterium]
MLAGFAVAVLVGVSAAIAQTASPPPAYRPGLGDLMIETIQSRHIKLALAGRSKNWPLASFELGQMEESFERVARVWPTWRSYSIADMVEVVKAPMAALQEAVKAKDAQRFAGAFGQLTEACNGCHAGVNRAMIVIKVPDASTYPDQDFAPKLQ